jgi:hypothetical protein
MFNEARLVHFHSKISDGKLAICNKENLSQSLGDGAIVYLQTVLQSST